MPAKPSATDAAMVRQGGGRPPFVSGVLAVVLALGYKLFQAWLVTGPAVNKSADAG